MPRLSPLALLPLFLLLCACGQGNARATSGDAERGGELARSYGCGACHEIPGVRGARGRVGPPLGGMGGRTVIAGVLPNTPANMVRWLRAPQSVVPGNGMPNTELSEHDAKDIAAYLFTLR